MDFGAEYANYASDMTRCVPVSGKFTPRQKDVYNAVLRVMKAAKKLLVPGTLLNEYHVEVGKLMEKELIDLGLITDEDIANQKPELPAYKKYFMHGTSHYLGLDVHMLVLDRTYRSRNGVYLRAGNLYSGRKFRYSLGKRYSRY